MTISNYFMGSDALDIEWQSGEKAAFSYFWLRDNARDPVSFDSHSHQRELFTAMIPPDVKPDLVKVATDSEAIIIKWPDLESTVDYKSNFLRAYCHPTDAVFAPMPKLWDSKNISTKLIKIDYRRALSAAGTKEMLKILTNFGFSLITNCPCEQKSVSKIAKKIGYIRETIFGGLWEFEANASMADSAYTPKELRPHTDSTYSLDAPGIQILLCMDYDAIGGESIMVDGFAVARQLKDYDANLFSALSQIDVKGIYKGDGVILEASRPIFRHDKQGRLTQVTFNNYDRATMRLAEREMDQLYAGIRYIDRLFNSPAYQWRHQLKAGEMLIFDNWRLLHGRGAFHGRRKMAGAYINREDFLSSLRVQSPL